MKRLLASLGLGLAAASFALPAVAGAQATTTSAPTATIVLLHGIPGATVDVVVDGQVLIPGFAPGTTQDLSSFAGQTLKNVEVRAAGKPDVLIGPIADLAVPAEGNVTVIAYLDGSGKPTLGAFVNDTAPAPAGQGKLTVRHTAAAPAVDIVVGDARPVSNLVNGKEQILVLPVGALSGAKIAPTGAAPIADVPTVEVKSGQDLIVYAVGSLESGSFTFYTQAVSDVPAGVPSGDSPVPGSATLWLLAGATVLVVVAAGSFMLARRPTEV